MRRYEHVDRYQEAIVEHLQELIRINSVYQTPAEPTSGGDEPFGPGPAEALRYALNLSRELRFETDHYGNIAGHAQYGAGGPLIGILVHLDVVPAGQGWRYPPFGGVIDDGAVYGRGASDNKGPAIAALYSLRSFADQVPDPPCRIRVIFGTNEENGMKAVRRYFDHFPLPDVAIVPDAVYPLFNREKGIANVHLTWKQGAAVQDPSEPGPPRDRHSAQGAAVQDPSLHIDAGTAMNVVPERARADVSGETTRMAKLAHRMSANCNHQNFQIESSADRLSITALGKPAHGGEPQKGINAIARLVAALTGTIVPGVSRLVDGTESPAQETQHLTTGPWQALDTLDHLIGEETDGRSLGIACSDKESGALSVNWATLTVTEGSVKAGLNVRYPVTVNFADILSNLKRTVGPFGFAVSQSEHLPPLYLPSDSKVIQDLLQAYHTVTGEAAEPMAMAGGTYARVLKNRGVCFGANFPGVDTQAHQADEFIRIDDLMRHARIQTEALFQLADIAEDAGNTHERTATPWNQRT